MLPSYYSEIEYLTLSTQQVRACYLEWVLGTKRFERLARRRQDAGIDPRWSLARLHEGTTFVGEYEARVESRLLDADGLLVRMVHRDADEPSILWHTIVQIGPGTDGPRVQHGVARGVPRRFARDETVGAAPGIVRNLLEWNGPNLRPRDIDVSSMLVEEADVVGFLDHVLLNPKRGLPLLVVTPSPFAGGQSLVNADHLAQRLAAMVRVVRLSTPEAARKLTDDLTARGFDRKFGVFDGGVRLYMPSLGADRSPYEHYLWIGSRISQSQPSGRDQLLVAEVAQQVLRHTVPRGFFQSVEQHDREARRQAAVAVLVKSLPPPPDEPDWDTTPEHALRSRQAELEAALGAATQDYGALAAEYESLELRCKSLDEERAERDQVIDELRDDIAAKRQLVVDLQERLDATKTRKSVESFDPALRAALGAALERRPTPEQSLLVVATLFPDRVIVHPRAISSARLSEGFKYPEQVLELLMLLVGQYWDALNSGKGDAHAKVIFGSRYASKESKTTIGNKRAADLRTVHHRGRPYVLWPHLRIGVKQDSDAETFRAHFEWLADERRILIGHCGPHLDLR